MSDKDFSITDKRIELKDIFTTDDLPLIEKSIRISKVFFLQTLPKPKSK